MFSQAVNKIAPSASIAISEKAKKMKEQGIDLIDLSIGQPDLPVPPNVIEAAKRALDQGKTAYTNSRGIIELRLAVADYLKRRQQLDYSPEEIIITPGGRQAILYTLQSILSPGEEVIVPEPCWLSYQACIVIAGGCYKPLPALSAGQLAEQKEKLLSLITPKTRAILINNPVNPTAVIWSREDLSAVAEIAKRFNLWVISDEIYDRIVFDNYPIKSIASLPDMRQRTILVNGFSKTYSMTGLRIGYLAACQELTSQIIKIQQHSATCAPSVSQYAALAALTEQTESYVEKARQTYQQRRDLVWQGFNNQFCSTAKSQGTFYAFLDISKISANSLEAADLILEKAKIAVVPGLAYGQAGEGYVRIAFTLGEEKLKQAIDNFNSFIGQL